MLQVVSQLTLYTLLQFTPALCCCLLSLQMSEEHQVALACGHMILVILGITGV